MSALRVVTEADFDDVVLASPVPVLVEFFTEWCAPCKALAPTLEDLSDEYGDSVRIVTVDAERSPDLGKRYDVTGYPTMVLVKDGAEVSRPQVRTRLQLREVLDDARGVVRASAEAPVLPAEDPPLASALVAVLEQLATLDAEAWKQVEARVTELSQRATPSTEVVHAVDDAAVTAATSRLLNDVEELAAARLGDSSGAQAIASAASASFERWVRRSPVAPGWAGALRAVPAARMSPYLPAGDAPADPVAAGAAYLEKLGLLSDDEWVRIRTVNRDIWPFDEHKDRGMGAFLAAVILLQALTTPELVPAVVHDACWEPFDGLLDREGIAA